MSSLYLIPSCYNWLRYESVIFKRDKTAEFNLYVTCNGLIDYAEIFTNIISSANFILTNEIRFLLALYRASKKESINKYRFLNFVKNTMNNTRVKLSCLSTTTASAINTCFLCSIKCKYGWAVN